MTNSVIVLSRMILVVRFDMKIFQADVSARPYTAPPEDRDTTFVVTVVLIEHLTRLLRITVSLSSSRILVLFVTGFVIVWGWNR